MTGKTPFSSLCRLLVVAGIVLGGCSHAYVNPDIANPAEAKKRLAADSAICTQEANMDEPPSYGLERFEFDPTIEAQATRWVANVAEDDEHLDAYSRCMHQRGWRFKK